MSDEFQFKFRCYVRLCEPAVMTIADGARWPKRQARKVRQARKKRRGWA